MTDFAERLKRARTDAGFATMQSAVDRFGFQYSTYVAHENGERNPRRDAVDRYAKSFKVSPFWLLHGVDQPSAGEATRDAYTAGALSFSDPDSESIPLHIIERAEEEIRNLETATGRTVLGAAYSKALALIISRLLQEET